MIRSLSKIHGGKSYLSKWIVDEVFPKDYIFYDYVEPFGGFAAVLTYKKMAISQIEVYNELNPNIFNSFVALKSFPSDLIKTLNSIEYNEENFNRAKANDLNLHNLDVINIAVNEIVRRRFSRGGLAKDYGWSDRPRRGKPEYISSWETFRQDVLPNLIGRFKNVVLLNENGIDLVNAYNNSNVIIYNDPPYLKSTRSHKTSYGDYEFSVDNHALLAYNLNKSNAKCLISCYDSPEYASWYKNWNRHAKSMPNHSGQGRSKQKRVEVLLTNY